MGLVNLIELYSRRGHLMEGQNSSHIILIKNMEC